MGKRIVLIEDDLAVQNIYSSKLTLHGYEVSLAADSDHGLQLVKETLPNIILLDIMIPGKMNGLELLELFKKDDKTSKIPVIVLTNLDTEKANALKIGASVYLVKANTNLNVLLEKVDEFAR